ncbi:hypothetical protein WICMUC_003348 [Wickerhamomyces mucosus]|uniref:EamA domain-containing protein n=1 Tax=Wickerhamomyces mucosus TaxID=1378264 RepID=A0A9P8PLB3_9ASCO|nr:hypothetical protein WICMUC_003348 [Wickerhamomyces mucosus]
MSTNIQSSQNIQPEPQNREFEVDNDIDDFDTNFELDDIDNIDDIDNEISNDFITDQQYEGRRINESIGYNNSINKINYTIDKFKIKFFQFYFKQIQPIVGLLLIILSQFFNSLMVVSTKLLVTDPEFTEPIHPLQILFVRMILTFLGCFTYLKYVMKVDEVFGPKQIRPYLIIRGVVGFVGVFSLYYSLLYLSVSDAVTITFLVPSVTGFLAWIILGERWTLIEAGGGLVSLLGVVLIARPSFIFGDPTNLNTDKSVESSNPKERLIATLVALCGVLGASGVYIVIRKIRGKVHSLITVQYFAIVCVFITFSGLILIPGLGFRVPTTGKQWFLFFGLGISGFFMQFLLTEGIMREKASRASAMLYVQIVYSIFWEIIIWNHLPNLSSWLGILIILGSAFIVIYKKNEDIKPPDVENTFNTIQQRHEINLNDRDNR